MMITLNNVDQVKQIICNTAWLMEALRAVEELNLPQCYIGAGSIRNVVWNHLHGYKNSTPESDIDVVYYDHKNLMDTHEHDLKKQLLSKISNTDWEVANQARVHLWYEKCYGIHISPFLSTCDAVSSWPETATCIAAQIENQDIKILAPLGLDDLLSMKVRWNPKLVTSETYLSRVNQKKYNDKWPKVEVIPPN